MAATFRAVGTVAASANSVANPTNLSPGLPTRQADDVLLLFTESRSRTATVATPSGWVLLPGYPVASATTSGGKQYVFARVVDGTETTPTVSWSGVTTGTSGDSCMAVIKSYSGADITGTNLANLLASNVGTTDAAATTSITIPAITTTEDDAQQVAFVMRVNDTAHTFTATGWSERIDGHTTTGTGHGRATYDRTRATAGATGTSTATPSNTTSSRVLVTSFALAAAPVEPNPKIETLTDAFDNLGAWFTGGTPAIVGGELQMGSTAGVADQVSSTTQNLDLTGSDVFIEVTQYASGDYRECFFGVVAPGGNPFQTADLGFFLTGDGSGCNVHVNGADSGQSFTFSVASTPWLRIRESGGTVYFETATDPTGTWTQRGTATTPSFATACQVLIGIFYVNSAADPVATFDNLNSAGAPADATPPTTDVSATVLRLSRVAGKDSTDLTITADEAFVEYDVRIVPAANSLVTAGTSVESGTVSARTSHTTTITDDEIVAAAGSGTFILKAFTRDAAGNWST